MLRPGPRGFMVAHPPGRRIREPPLDGATPPADDPRVTSVAAAAARGPLRCQLHPRELAGWRCTSCSAPLCPDCAAPVTPEHGHPYVTCGRCGAIAQTLTRARAEAVPFWRRLLRAPRDPLSPGNLLAMVLLAGVLHGLSFLAIGLLGLFVQLVRGGLYWSYVFFLIRNTGAANRLSMPDFRSLGSDVFLPLVRGAVGTALVWAPALVYLAVSPWTWRDLAGGSVLLDPVLWLLALGGVLYAPMALIAAATDIGLGGMLNPVQIASYIRRIGRDYFLAVAALVLVLPLQVGLLVGVSRLSASLPVPLLGGFLVQLGSLYATFVWACILGTVLHVHGYALDWGSDESYQEPVLGDTPPRGARVVPAPRGPAVHAPIEALPLAADVHAAAPAPHAGSHDARAIPIALDGPGPPAPLPAVAVALATPGAHGGGVGVAAMLAAPALAFTPPPAARATGLPVPASGAPPAARRGVALGIQEEISLPPLPPPEAPDPELVPALADGALDTGGVADPDAFANMPDSGVVRMPEFLGPAAPVKEALAHKDFARAVELFAQEPAFLVLHLAPPEIFILAAALAQHKQVPLAISALKRIALSADPVAPKAMFLLARLYTDARHDYDNAERMFRSLMQKYPDSKEADAARAHLKKLGY